MLNYPDFVFEQNDHYSLATRKREKFHKSTVKTSDNFCYKLNKYWAIEVCHMLQKSST